MLVLTTATQMILFSIVFILIVLTHIFQSIPTLKKVKGLLIAVLLMLTEGNYLFSMTQIVLCYNSLQYDLAWNLYFILSLIFSTVYIIIYFGYTTIVFKNIWKFNPSDEQDSKANIEKKEELLLAYSYYLSVNPMNSRS